MVISRAGILVPGATGVLGSALAVRLHEQGAALAVAGRDREGLARVSRACGDAPARAFDAYDLEQCARTVAWAAGELGGLDAVVVCVGVAAFGPAESVSDAVAEHLFTVNTLAPLAFLRAALAVVEPGGVIAAITGVVADSPSAGMADYSASKAGLATWLRAVRREQRASGVTVLEIRLPHVETGFAGRAVLGTPPALPAGLPVAEAVDAIVAALSAGARVVKPGRDAPLDAER
ncbi:SDR family oxidoreductase [Streptomyces populi]|uniref:SDR family oxidoreductase n=1 Tax=Streptomyces populi TaxID=2058924 RepID=A0A2I0SMV0_9ACTN|nr:SDR family oxidoreductase [Streptomyces populi]PKT71224.1 SDR family oxidoreductase [Streptomyces populi]